MPQNLDFMASYEVVDQVSCFFVFKKKDFFNVKKNTFLQNIICFLKALSWMQPYIKRFLENKNVHLCITCLIKKKILQQYEQLHVIHQTKLG